VRHLLGDHVNLFRSARSLYLTTVVEVLPTGVVVEYVVVAGVVVTTVAGVGSRLSTVVVLTLHAASSSTAEIKRSIRIIA